MEELPFFRASKKRKLARQRESEPEIEPTTSSVQVADGAPLDNGRNDHEVRDVEDEVSVSDLVKLRRQRMRKGVQYNNISNARANTDDDQSLALIKSGSHGLESEASEVPSLENMDNRFTTATGQVVDVDKHMMAYIDSQIARRHGVQTPTASAMGPPQPHSRFNHQRRYQQQQSDQAQFSAAGPTNQDSDDNSYTDEDDDRDDNINDQDVTMDAAEQSSSVPQQSPDQTRRTQSSHLPHFYHLTEVTLPTDVAADKAKEPKRPKPRPAIPLEGPFRHRRPPRKQRLGRDGKPLRPRPRKRRDSSDIARDLLVEQVLSENRVGPDSNNTTAVNNTDRNNNNDKNNNNNKPSTSTSQPNTFDPSSTENPTTTTTTKPGLNPEADERLAAAFKREFMDAMAERRASHRHNHHPSSSSSSSKKHTHSGIKPNIGGSSGGAGASTSGQTATGFVHGPKLGGSRSARAKMVASIVAERDRARAILMGEDHQHHDNTSASANAGDSKKIPPK